jgi:predicted RNase H-like HicB family nuclease
MTRIFTAIYEKIGKWYIAYIEELPGVNTQGKTLNEARRNLKEALELILETNQILAKSQIQSRHPIRETVKIDR